MALSAKIKPVSSTGGYCGKKRELSVILSYNDLYYPEYPVVFAFLVY
jgi:hypothetical protein